MTNYEENLEIALAKYDMTFTLNKDDIRVLVYSLKKVRKENAELKKFINALGFTSEDDDLWED